MYSFVKAKLTDAAEILALQQLAYQSEAAIYNDWELPPLIQNLDSLKSEFSNSIILKAVVDQKIIGSVRSTLDANNCKIGRLIVHPDYQRQGIGSALLKKIESIHINVERFELFTGSKSLGNIRLYEKHGYKTSQTKSLSDTLEIVFMDKPNTNPLAFWNDFDPGVIYRHMFGTY